MANETQRMPGQQATTKRTGWSHSTATFLEYLMAAGLLAIASVVILQVILSSCFNSAIVGGNEVITKLFVYLTTIGSAVAIQRREHIAITWLTDSMSPTRQRFVDIVGTLLVAALNVLVLVYSFKWINVTGHYLMPTTQLPRNLAQVSVPIGATIAVLFCVSRILQSLFKSDRSQSSIETGGRSEAKK